MKVQSKNSTQTVGLIKDGLNLRVKYLPLSKIKPSKTNARKHSESQIQQIAQSFERFGVVNPILIDQNNRVVAGHGRFEAAKKLGHSAVPTVRIEHLTPAELRAYALADNKIALNASWDQNILAIELQEITNLDLGFDLELTGFSTAEIDVILDDSISQQDLHQDADLVPELRTVAVSQPGDLWILGDHRLLCGNALKHQSYLDLLGKDKVRMVFADPPYNVKIDGHAGGLGKIKHREFVMASGEMSEKEFRLFLENFMDEAAYASVDGAIHFICMDWRHIADVILAGRKIYSDLKNICVWNKYNGGMGSLYRSKHELVCVFKNGTKTHINNVALGANGRYRTNVWDYAGVNSTKAGRLQELAMHPTVKPVALVIDAIKDCSNRGDLILDPFAGSGTTIIAAEKSGRAARAIELDPLYVDVAIRRWQLLTKRPAILKLGKKSFAEVAKQRHSQEEDAA